MKISIYTVSNEKYFSKLKMMLNSLLSYNDNIDIHILLTNFNKQTDILFSRPSIFLHDVSKDYIKYSSKYGPSRACKKIKSLIHTYINIKNYDILIYSDCDVIFYNNIDKLFLNKNLDLIQLSYDGGRQRGLDMYKICTGFFFFSPKQYPDLLNDWGLEIDKMIINKPKFLDQPAMKNVLELDNYKNNFDIIPPDEVSQKFKRPNAIATHYIRKKSGRMYSDYLTFFGNEYKML